MALRNAKEVGEFTHKVCLEESKHTVILEVSTDVKAAAAVNLISVLVNCQ